MIFRLLPYLIAISVVFGVLGGAWKTGYNYAIRKSEVNELKKQIATLQKDVEIAKEAKEDELKKNDELEELAQRLKEQVDEISNQSGGCTLSDDDVKRLRNLRLNK